MSRDIPGNRSVVFKMAQKKTLASVEIILFLGHTVVAKIPVDIISTYQ